MSVRSKVFVTSIRLFTPADPSCSPNCRSPHQPQTGNRCQRPDWTGLYALAALAGLLGTIAIANATLLNTIERRPEIGLRRALGATRTHIIRQITLEASVTGAIAGIAGTAIAIYAIAAIAHQRHWTATINPTLTLAAPLIGLATGTIAGIGPALKAAQTPPAATLRT